MVRNLFPRLPRAPRLGIGLALGASLLSGGCQGTLPGSIKAPESIQVAIATGAGSDQVVRSSLKRLADQMASEFMRVHPGASLHLRFLGEAELLESVRSRASLGAGPDLMISRTPPVVALQREGLLGESGLSATQLDPLRLQFLPNFRDGNVYRALPFLLQPSLACFNRAKVPQAPTRLEQLISQAAAGVRVGLPLQVDELLWSASGFDADKPILRLFSDEEGTQPRRFSETEVSEVNAWLRWLYRANVQPTVYFVDTSDELVQRLETKQLDWISCNANAIPRLRRSLGSKLGVSVLPSGANADPARPMARLLVISFGRDSTPSQRSLAESFALFMLNDITQNSLLQRAFGNMPVNRNVIVPVKDSPVLAAMESSLEASTVPSFRQGVELRQRTEALRQLLKQTIYGEVTAQQAIEDLQALAGASAASSAVPTPPIRSSLPPQTPSSSVPAAPAASRKP
jgi:ABC-type glycerol-3-phosphate transport system substrate-binding protein